MATFQKESATLKCSFLDLWLFICALTWTNWYPPLYPEIMDTWYKRNARKSHGHIHKPKPQKGPTLRLSYSTTIEFRSSGSFCERRTHRPSYSIQRLREESSAGHSLIHWYIHYHNHRKERLRLENFIFISIIIFIQKSLEPIQRLTWSKIKTTTRAVGIKRDANNPTNVHLTSIL